MFAVLGAESPPILPLAGDEIPLSQQGTPAGNKRNDTLKNVTHNRMPTTGSVRRLPK